MEVPVIGSRMFRAATHFFLRANARAFRCLPANALSAPALRPYGEFLNLLVRRSSARTQNSSTFFLRNRPELELIRDLGRRQPQGATVKLLVLACSNGAEVYSILWALRSIRPDLRVLTHAIDISKEVVERAQRAAYPANDPSLFERMTPDEKDAIFDMRSGEYFVKPWLKEGIVWIVDDATDRELSNRIGTHDLVIANRFLCHMNPPDAEACLRNIPRLVQPDGYLFVSGIDIEVRTRVAADLTWEPVADRAEQIHEGDKSLRDFWPWGYWTIEPISKRRADWRMRYAAVFRPHNNARSVEANSTFHTGSGS
jgi:chemotaxis methyl-accepting protein methylase